jgi:branched-chain amino acid aminotransferase
MIGEIVYVNGTFVHKDEAKISVFDHNFIYGDGVFEGLQAVNGGIFKLRQHIDRLYQSARFLAIEIPMTPEKFIGDVLETGRRNRLKDGYMRPVVSRGVGPVGVRNMDELGPPTIVIIAQHEKIEDRRSAFESGISAHVASVRRIPPECMDPRVKTCNYINNILAYMEAKHAGAHTAIMLDMQGYVSEGYGNNLFAVKDGVLLTPPIGNILAGITRETVLELAAKHEIKTLERPMTVYDFVNADEVFESATMAELTPIVEIDGRKVAEGKVGQITGRLHRELRTLMERGEESARITN